MQENPYSAMLGVIRKDTREQKSSAWALGIVESAAPLVIRYGDMPLRGADLLVNYQLRANAEGVTLSGVTGSLSGTADCTKGSITGMQVSGGSLTASGIFGGVLLPGDQVVMLMSEDQQQFIVLCKAVAA